MDLVQIGKFIAELRKEQELTQEQLGEKIGVTNKTVSRWENGNYLPPSDVLLAMSQLFDVSVNEILSGKRLLAEEYKEAAETNLTQTLKASSFSLKERIDFYKAKWLKEHISIMVFIVSDGTLWEGQIALYFRWTCLPDCAVPELEADYRRNNRRLS